MNISFTIKSPSECSEDEIEKFIIFVSDGGEVTARGLKDRLMNAFYLAFIYEEDRLIGTAALKIPDLSYRRRIESSSNVSLTEKHYPYELGWIYLTPNSRGNGYSYLLVSELLKVTKNIGVFATSRIDNVAMHKTLIKLGFIEAGKEYGSKRGTHFLKLFKSNNTPN